jgi:hypothetical protein
MVFKNSPAQLIMGTCAASIFTTLELDSFARFPCKDGGGINWSCSRVETLGLFPKITDKDNPFERGWGYGSQKQTVSEPNFCTTLSRAESFLSPL